MSVTEGGQSDVWPPKPTAQPGLIEVGTFRILQTPERLTIANPSVKKIFWCILFGLLVLEIVLFILIVQSLILVGDFKLSGSTLFHDFSVRFFLVHCTGLFIVCWLGRKASDNLSEPMIADRAHNELFVQKKKRGSLSDLHRVEIKLNPWLPSWNAVYAVTTDPRKPSKERRILVTQSRNPMALRQMGQTIADYLSVPLEVK